jgi:hypothetical protein
MTFPVERISFSHNAVLSRAICSGVNSFAAAGAAAAAAAGAAADAKERGGFSAAAIAGERAGRIALAAIAWASWGGENATLMEDIKRYLINGSFTLFFFQFLFV